MKRTIPLAEYIFRRLRQYNIQAIHGVPGDFTLKALDHLKATGQRWVGNCNELNSGYAADGYARVRGLGALFTTYGVGELSAINAIAGSYAEHVPVVHVVGLPQRHLLRSGAIVHHTLGDGRTRIYAEMHKKVTVAQAFLDDQLSAPQRFDDTVGEALRHSLPVYVELPADMVSAEVDAAALGELPKHVINNPGSIETNVQELHKRIKAAKQPLLLVDRGHGMDGLRKEINLFVQRSGIPTLALPSGASMVEHSLPNYYGTHAGPVGQMDTMPYLESSDLVIALGPMFSDTQTLGWKIVPPASKSVIISRRNIKFCTDPGTDVDAKLLLEQLTETFSSDRVEYETSSLGNFRTIKPSSSTNPTDPLDQTNFYLRLNPYLRPGDIILLGNATPIIGGRDFVLPSPSCKVIASGMWFSIGHMLPAAQGAALAQQEPSNFKEGRTILFDGDGSFQMTVQELSTIIRLRLNMTIFIINNGGYAYERQIHGMHEEYNNIAPWQYLDLPRVFGGDHVVGKDYSIDTFRMETWSDLDRFLADEALDNGEGGRGRRGLKLVEVFVGKYDIPEKFEQVFKAARAAL